MKKFSQGQYALGGFAFLGIWVLIMSQNIVGDSSGFGVLFNLGWDTDARPPLIFISLIFIGLSVFCFYKALRDNRD